MGWFNHSHVPQYLERNPIFRFVFLFRKLFLTKQRQFYFGQEAEDVALRRIFPKHFKGFFVDVGCFHPIKYNNTYYLYKKGWRGINIDIDTIKIKGFNWVRRKDINIATAISNKKGETDYWTNGFYSLVNTLEKPPEKKLKEFKKKKITCNTLSNIIDDTKYKNQVIDLLCIDAEGHDLVVLQSLDFDRYDPKVIVVETFAKDMKMILDLPIFRYLEEKNYTLINWVGLSLFFKKKDLIF